MALPRKTAWIGGVVAVVAVLALVGQCGRGADDEDATALPVAAPLTGTPRAVATAVVAPIPTTANPAPVRTAAPTPTSTARRAPTTSASPNPQPQPAPQPQPQPDPAEDQDDGGEVYYENCDAVRAAGAAPIRRGDPGYRSGLDRDGDGEGCGGD